MNLTELLYLGNKILMTRKSFFYYQNLGDIYEYERYNGPILSKIEVKGTKDIIKSYILRIRKFIKWVTNETPKIYIEYLRDASYFMIIDFELHLFEEEDIEHINKKYAEEMKKQIERNFIISEKVEEIYVYVKNLINW